MSTMAHVDGDGLGERVPQSGEEGMTVRRIPGARNGNPEKGGTPAGAVAGGRPGGFRPVGNSRPPGA